ncbi:MAG: glycosyltransferase family 2 protein [candidate division Zixibacteria bacterium]|nr:glycosyltransferase family 2 protein [candidate division Zixibacteria bacterium]
MPKASNIPIAKTGVNIPPGIRSISIVLPAYNEEDNIMETGRRAVNICNQLPVDDYEILIINDGSSDKTGELVRELITKFDNISLIEHDKNIGYGGSLKSGLIAAKSDIVFFTDSDLQFDFGELPEFIEKLHDCDMVIGYRAKRPENIIRRLNAFGWGLLIKILFGLKVRDIDCAFKIFRHKVLHSISMDSIGAFINSEILIRARDKGFIVKESPVSHFPRPAGKSSGAKLKTIIKAFKELFSLYGELKQNRCQPNQNRAFSS